LSLRKKIEKISNKSENFDVRTSVFDKAKSVFVFKKRTFADYRRKKIVFEHIPLHSRKVFFRKKNKSASSATQ